MHSLSVMYTLQRVFQRENKRCRLGRRRKPPPTPVDDAVGDDFDFQSVSVDDIDDIDDEEENKVKWDIHDVTNSENDYDCLDCSVSVLSSSETSTPSVIAQTYTPEPLFIKPVMPRPAIFRQHKAATARGPRDGQLLRLQPDISLTSRPQVMKGPVLLQLPPLGTTRTRISPAITSFHVEGGVGCADMCAKPQHKTRIGSVVHGSTVRLTQHSISRFSNLLMVSRSMMGGGSNDEANNSLVRLRLQPRSSPSPASISNYK
jgi:hypothetical protein